MSGCASLCTAWCCEKTVARYITANSCSSFKKILDFMGFCGFQGSFLEEKEVHNYTA